MLQKGSAKEDDGITMKHMKSPRIVTSMFLIDDLTVVNLISASPFFNSTDDAMGGIVYIYSKIRLVLVQKQHMKETSGPE
jgi:hypothetical protein